MAGEDNRYAIDIRVFVSVIVIAMAVSFGVGVGLGPTAHSQIAMTAPTPQLPPVTSVDMQTAESALADLAAADDGEVHEPAGQVRKIDSTKFVSLIGFGRRASPTVSFLFAASFGRHQRHRSRLFGFRRTPRQGHG